MQVRDRHLGTICVEQNCACVRVRKGLVLRVCLQVSCGAPPRPTALDPPLMYCTLVMPYLTYCCEVWGNNYKTRIQSLFILQKRAIRIICLNANYKCHTKPLFFQLRSLNVFDIIDLNSLVFVYKAFHNSLPANLLSYFKKLMAATIITHEIIISISKYDTEELLKKH